MGRSRAFFLKLALAALCVRYTIAGATSKSTTGTAAAAGANGTGGSNGTADQYTIGLTVAIPGDQAGTGADGGGTHTRTLTISY